MRSRFRLAVVISPVVVVLTVWLGFVVTTALWLRRETTSAEIAQSAQHLLMFFLFFGLPLAYLSLVFGIPIYYELERRGRLRPAYVIGAATLLGGLLVPAVWGLFFNSVGGAVAFLPTGIAAGAAGGATFWCLARPSASSQPPA